MIEALVAASVIMQSLELLKLKPAYADNGIWRWGTIRGDGGLMPRLLTPLLAMPRFQLLILLQILCAAALPFFHSAALSGALFLTTLLICMRWRGTLNGGSDYMTLQTLGALTVALAAGAGSSLARFALAYLAMQATLSYFTAGWAKATTRGWWSGEALRRHMGFRAYGVPRPWRAAMGRPIVAVAASWAIMAFELSFPAVWAWPPLAPYYLAGGALFHLVNAYALGLNRFFWAWIAVYPAFQVLT